jgi:hypothetical protein
VTFKELRLGGLSLSDQLHVIQESLVSDSEVHVHFEWLHDLKNRSLILQLLEKSQTPWSAFASISEIWRLGANCTEWELLKLSHQFSGLVSIFTWDHHLIKEIITEFPKLSPLQDFQNLEITEETFDCCAWAELDNRPILGISGQLYGYRGVDFLLWRFLLLSNFRLILWGTYKENDITSLSKLILKLFRNTDKIYIRKDWIERETELNHFYQHISGFFLDGSRYPNPSGMANRALSFQIPLLVQKGRGYYAYESETHSGVLYHDFRFISNSRVREILSTNQPKPQSDALSLTGQITSMKNVWDKLFT